MPLVCRNGEEGQRVALRAEALYISGMHILRTLHLPFPPPHPPFPFPSPYSHSSFSSLSLVFPLLSLLLSPSSFPPSSLPHPIHFDSDTKREGSSSKEDLTPHLVKMSV